MVRVVHTHHSQETQSIHSASLPTPPSHFLFVLPSPRIPTSTPLQRLPPLPLRLDLILKREPTRPLIRPRLPTNPPIATRKQDAPDRHGAEEAAAGDAKAEAQDARVGPQHVGVEGVEAVEEGGDGEGGEGVGRLGVGRVGRCWTGWGSVSEGYGGIMEGERGRTLRQSTRQRYGACQ